MNDEESKGLFSPSARSLPNRPAFIWALSIGFFHYLSLVTMLTLAWLLLFRHRSDVLIGFLIATGIVAMSWLAGYIARRNAKCPLCRGTPLLDSSAAKHKKALRLPLLTPGVTALVHLILTHRFRCMYCGTPFDLAKKPQRN